VTENIEKKKKEILWKKTYLSATREEYGRMHPIKYATDVI